MDKNEEIVEKLMKNEIKLREVEKFTDNDSNLAISFDVYWDNIRVDALEDLDSDLIARVVVDGWDKLIARPDGLQRWAGIRC